MRRSWPVAADRTLLRILGLGVVSGLRTMTGPALLVRYLQAYPPEAWPHPALRLLCSEQVGAALQLLAGSEMIADKLAFIPARTGPLPLGGRAASGAAVGALLSALDGRSAWAGAGAALGGAAAVLGAHAGYHARRLLAGENELPDVAVALVEDAVVLGLGQLVLGGDD